MKGDRHSRFREVDPDQMAVACAEGPRTRPEGRCHCGRRSSRSGRGRAPRASSRTVNFDGRGVCPRDPWRSPGERDGAGRMEDGVARRVRPTLMNVAQVRPQGGGRRGSRGVDQRPLADDPRGRDGGRRRGQPRASRARRSRALPRAILARGGRRGVEVVRCRGRRPDGVVGSEELQMIEPVRQTRPVQASRLRRAGREHHPDQEGDGRSDEVRSHSAPHEGPGHARLLGPREGQRCNQSCKRPL